jgi:hypothetical protein
MTQVIESANFHGHAPGKFSADVSRQRINRRLLSSQPVFQASHVLCFGHCSRREKWNGCARLSGFLAVVKKA